MGAPVSRVHHCSTGGELVGQSQAGRRADRGDGDRSPPGREHSRTVDGCSPAQAQHSHHQGHQDSPEQQLTAVRPIPLQQAEHPQGEAQQGRQDAERAAVADREGHHPDQHQTEDRHGCAQHKDPPAAGSQHGRALGHQRRHRQHQHGPVGQQPEQRQGLAQQAAPGTGEHFVAAVAAEKALATAAERTQHPPGVEGDRAGVNHADGGQHGHHHPHPAGATLRPAALGAEALTEATGGHAQGIGGGLILAAAVP